VSSPLHIWGLSPVPCGLTSVNLTFGYIFFSNYRAQDRSERHHFIRALYKFIYVDGNIYCIVTVMRFVIILIKFYVCMYGRTRSSARGDLAVQRTRTVRRRTCIRRRRSGSMEPVAVLRSQLSASVDSFKTALKTFSVHCQYLTVYLSSYIITLLRALYDRSCTAPLNQLPCYGALEIIVTLILHCALSLAAQCIVIGPVCGFVCVCVLVCGSVTTITRNCVHRSSPNWVCR